MNPETIRQVLIPLIEFAGERLPLLAAELSPPRTPTEAEAAAEALKSPEPQDPPPPDPALTEPLVDGPAPASSLCGME